MSAVNNSFDKKDMEIILEINRKAIEIESEAVSQNEEIIDLISTNKDKLDILNSEIIGIKNDLKNICNIIEKIKDKTDDMDKSFFQIKVVFTSGIFICLLQIAEFIFVNFIKK